MAFLKRSMSQKAREVKETASLPPPPPAQRQPEPEPPEQDDPDAKKERRKSRFERHRSIFGRSKSASDTRKSINIERPRTANRAAPDPLPESIRELPSQMTIAGETIEIRSGGDTFNFPTPSPRLPPPPGTSSTFKASPLRLAEPQSLPAVIGVAIGSPTQAPPAWGRSFTADQVNSRIGRSTAMNKAQPAIPEDQAAEAGALPELRKKKSGWKTWGGLFGRKAPRPAVQEPFYKVQIPQSQQQHQYAVPARTPHSPPSVVRPLVETPSPSQGMSVRSPGSMSSHHSRTPSINRGLARFEARAEADRHSFMPNIDSKTARTHGHANRGSVGTLSPPLRALESIRDSADLFKTMPSQVEVEQEKRDSPMLASNTRVVLAGATSRTPLYLDLDIPGAEMERYSVMFEKLLEPRQSILERRQSSKAKRQKSQTARRKDLPAIPTPSSSCGPSPIETKPATGRPSRSVPQRSVTSPHLKRGPSLTISVGSKKSTGNPKAPSREQVQEEPVTAIHRPRPTQRSKTAPPGSVSPVAPNFSRPKPPTFASSCEDLSPESPLYGEDSLPPTPTTIASLPDDKEGIAVLSHEPPPVARRRQRMGNDSVDQQSWDMLTSEPAETQQSQNAHQAQYPRINSSADLERQIVQVSVARQVSVRKARRLVQRAQVESKQPVKPRVVEMGGREKRKSTHVVLIEEGDG